MCSITGVVFPTDSQKNVLVALGEGLVAQEQRGYDSAGLAIIVADGTSRVARIAKMPLDAKTQSVSDLLKQPEVQGWTGTIGIGHTRWATHGGKTHANAHPHSDNQNEVIIAHNGQIDNFRELRAMLQAQGCVFKSETDSEVIAHLISYLYKKDNRGNLEQAVIRTLKLLQGTYGLVVMHTNHHKLVVARKGSPVIVGQNGREKYVASIPEALAGKAKEWYALGDDQIAVLSPQELSFVTINGEELSPELHEMQITLADMDKGDHRYYMLKEIMEQPERLPACMAGHLLPDNTVKLSLGLQRDLVSRIFMVACGTSYHAALYAKYLIESLVGIPVVAEIASEFANRSQVFMPGDILWVITQSGETTDTLLADELARRAGVPTFAIANVVGSMVTRTNVSGVYTHMGPERGVASTKAFTGQLAALLQLALFLTQQSPETMGHNQRLVPALRLLPDAVARTLQHQNKMQELAERYKDAPYMIFLGRGYNYPIALEGSLKAKEIGYVPVEAQPMGELKHGPFALLKKGIPIILLMPQDETYGTNLNSFQQMLAHDGTDIIAIGTQGDSTLPGMVKEFIGIPPLPPELFPVVAVVPLQLFAYYLSLARGNNPDKPDNLAKSVTVA